MNKLFCIALVLLSIIFIARFSNSGEHPGEHPGKKEVLKSSEIIKGIKDHINKVTGENGGFFPITDEVEKKDLRLKLIKVHEDKVSYIPKEGCYFACTDFIEGDGKTVYDLDFWMKKDSKDILVVHKTAIHKKDGKPRFTYKDDEIVEVK